MLQLPPKFGGPKLNPHWLALLTGSSGSNHALNEHEDAAQYDSYAMPSEIM